MNKEKMKKIDVNNGVWDQLHDLRKELKYKKWSAVVQWLLDHQSSQEKNTPVPVNNEKLLQDMLPERTWNRIIQIKESRGFDSILQVLICLLDAYNLLQNEKAQQSLKAKTDLEDIHNYIEKIRPALPKSSMVATPPTPKDQDHVSDTGKSEWLSCPVCHYSFPLLVELDEGGSPLKKHEDGIEYKMVDGVLQRRFSGPDDNYLPFQIQTGGKVIVEDSMAISTLRRLNKKLFDDFTNTLKNTTHKFTGGMW